MINQFINNNSIYTTPDQNEAIGLTITRFFKLICLDYKLNELETTTMGSMYTIQKA